MSESPSSLLSLAIVERTDERRAEVGESCLGEALLTFSRPGTGERVREREGRWNRTEPKREGRERMDRDRGGFLRLVCPPFARPPRH